MKIKYELDKDKFVKVYNELNYKLDTSVLDTFNLMQQHNITYDNKTLQQIMYAIENNIEFEIVDIPTVQEINNMYTHYENPNRLTHQDLMHVIKEINHIETGLIIDCVRILNVFVTKQNHKHIELGVTVRYLSGDVSVIWAPMESMLKTLKDCASVNYTKECAYHLMTQETYKPKGFFENIKLMFKEWGW